MKSWLRDPLLTIANSRMAVVGALTASALTAAGLFTLFEHAHNDALIGHPKAGFWIGLYWAITTMTTTGYGDVSPVTIPGQFLASCLMLWSTFFLLPVVVAHVITRLLHDPNAWTDAEQCQLLEDVRAIRRATVDR